MTVYIDPFRLSTGTDFFMTFAITNENCFYIPPPVIFFALQGATSYTLFPEY